MGKIDNSEHHSYPFAAHLGVQKLQEERFEHYPLEEWIARAWLDMLAERWHGDPNSALEAIVDAPTNEREARLISSTIVWLVGTAVGSAELKKLVHSLGGEFTPPMPSEWYLPKDDSLLNEKALQWVQTGSIVQQILSTPKS